MPATPDSFHSREDKSSDDIIACAWHDVKRVTMLSTVHSNLTIDHQGRPRDQQGEVRTVVKPAMVASYNHSMSGVDLMDQTARYICLCSQGAEMILRDFPQSAGSDFDQWLHCILFHPGQHQYDSIDIS